jgi:hypothetical protein
MPSHCAIPGGNPVCVNQSVEATFMRGGGECLLRAQSHEEGKLETTTEAAAPERRRLYGDSYPSLNRSSYNLGKFLLLCNQGVANTRLQNVA